MYKYSHSIIKYYLRIVLSPKQILFTYSITFYGRGKNYAELLFLLGIYAEIVVKIFK